MNHFMELIIFLLGMAYGSWCTHLYFKAVHKYVGQLIVAKDADGMYMSAELADSRDIDIAKYVTFKVVKVDTPEKGR